MQKAEPEIIIDGVSIDCSFDDTHCVLRFKRGTHTQQFADRVIHHIHKTHGAKKTWCIWEEPEQTPKKDEQDHT